METGNGTSSHESHKQGAQPTFGAKGPAPLRFGVAIAPNPLNPDAVITVITTKTGFLRIRIFDVRGRLVGTLLNEERAPFGAHVVQVGGPKQPAQLASGVYFYEIDASEGKLSGRIAVVK
jgi:hypothetical protein